MSVDLVRVPHSEAVTLQGWDLGYGKFDAMVAEDVAEAITNTFGEDEYRPRAYLPFMWSRHGDGLRDGVPVDPGTIYFSLPAFSANADTGPTFQTTLDALVEDLLGLFEDGGVQGAIHPSHTGQVEAMRDYFAGLSGKLNNALQRGNESKTGKPAAEK